MHFQLERVNCGTNFKKNIFPYISHNISPILIQKTKQKITGIVGDIKTEP